VPAWLTDRVRQQLRAIFRLTIWVGAFRKRRRCVLGPGAVLYPAARVENHRRPEDISIGDGSQILAELLTYGHGGRIEIGRRCFIGEDTRIWSADRIIIGDRALISYGVSIHDCNAHSLNAGQRAEHFNAIFGAGHPRELPDVPSAPIVIGNDAWIGFGVTIFKGVTIGNGAVIGACSVVTADVEPYTVVAGNPARYIKNAT
jgi:acetyltransferase-like isoleucine patch superfamily enzyme